MKKQAYITGLLFIFLTLALTSCKKDDQLSSLGDLLIGKWEMQNVRQVYYLDNVKKFEYIYYFEIDELAYEFTIGGSIIQYIYDVDGTSIFTLNDNLVIIENGDVDIEWADVTVNGNTLTWKQTGTETHNEVVYDVEYYFTATKSSK